MAEIPIIETVIATIGIATVAAIGAAIETTIGATTIIASAVTTVMDHGGATVIGIATAIGIAAVVGAIVTVIEGASFANDVSVMTAIADLKRSPFLLGATRAALGARGVQNR